MNDVLSIVLDTADGGEVRLIFKQYVPHGDWVCLVDDDFMKETREALELEE